MTSELSIDMNIRVLSMEMIIMDTKWFTKHRNFEIVHETRLHPNQLTDWPDALMGISPHTTQPITQIVILVVKVSSHFSCPECILSLSHQ